MSLHTVMEQLDGLGPLPALELPLLTECKHGHHALPVLFLQLLRALHHFVHGALVRKRLDQHTRGLLGRGIALVDGADEHALLQEVLRVVQREVRGEGCGHDDDWRARGLACFDRRFVLRARCWLVLRWGTARCSVRVGRARCTRLRHRGVACKGTSRVDLKLFRLCK